MKVLYYGRIGLVMLLLLGASHAIAQTDQQLPLAEQGANTPESYTFSERQTQLIELAGLLGQLHHYHQICKPYDYRKELFRDRMKELVALEEPLANTRQKMVKTFNVGFQTAKKRNDYCGYEAEQNMQRIADEGQDLTRKIAAPFRELEGYDYYAPVEGQVENGVTVYRGGQ